MGKCNLRCVFLNMYRFSCYNEYLAGNLHTEFYYEFIHDRQPQYMG